MVLRISFVGLVFLAFGCNSSSSSIETTENPEVLTGQQLFVKNCASCHGMDGKLGMSGAKDLTLSKLNREATIEIINKGKNNMPPFEMMLSSQSNVESVADFILSLKGKKK